MVSRSARTYAITAIAVSPDGQRILSASRDDTMKIWETATGRELQTLRGHDDDVTSAAFSPDGLRIVSGSEDGTMKVWDARTGKELRTLRGHDGQVATVGFSPDGQRVLSGGKGDDWYRDQVPPHHG